MNKNRRIGFWDTFIIFLYRNKAGVLGTLLFHILLFSVLLSFTLKTQRAYQEPEIFVEIPKEVDVEIKQQKEQEIRDKLQHKDSKNNEIKELLKSIAVNSEVKKNTGSQTNVEDMIKSIKKNLKTYQSDDIKNNKTTPEGFNNDSIKAQQALQQQKLDSLQNIEYSGKSSVYYKLKGRRKLYLPIPVFKCENEGKVVVQILVARNGRVLNAEVKGIQNDKCLVEAAIQAAKRTRFNSSSKAPAKQTGSITYHFIHQ